MRFPVSLRRLLMSILPILTVLGLVWALALQEDFFNLEQAQVDVELTSEQSALLAHVRPHILSVVDALEGQNIWRLSLKTLRNHLLESPWLEQVQVQRRFPNQISIALELKDLAYIHVDADGRWHPVAESGQVLPSLPPGLLPPKPILENKTLFAEPEMRMKVIHLMKQVPPLGILRPENIASVDYNPTTGLAYTLIEQDMEIFFGEMNVQTKALQVLKVTDYLESQKQKARVIDASFSKKVLVRLRKRS